MSSGNVLRRWEAAVSKGGVATNMALGIDTLDLNTTGANNVAVGYQALDANTIGAQNVGVGSQALGANTTGNDNVAVGYAALLVSRVPELRSQTRLDSIVSREASFLLNNYAFLALLVIVFYGTLFPVFSEAITGVR